MKVLFVNSSDLEGGAARAAYRLHKGLNDRDGVSSKMLVQRIKSNDPSVKASYGKSKIGIVYSSLRSTLDGFVANLQKSSNLTTHSTNWLPSGLHKRINKSDVDIVHLHWIGNGMISIREISKIKKPIVWTLHDMWALCGSEHYDDLNNPKRYNEGYSRNNFPLDYRGLDIDRWTWNRKMKHWSDKELNIVTPSRWLANCASASPLFENKKIQVIPNGLDLDLYKPIPKEWARTIMNIHVDEDKKYILFGAMSATSNKRKGFIQLKKALELVKDKNYHLLIFGSEGYNGINYGIPTTYLGRLNDDETLALAYSAADVMVVPSLQDNLPNTAVEAIACGTPVVSFSIGGLPDIVEDKKNGYFAKPFEYQDLANGINWILKNEERIARMSKSARLKAEQTFNIENIARLYGNLYESILD